MKNICTCAYCKKEANCAPWGENDSQICYHCATSTPEMEKMVHENILKSPEAQEAIKKAERMTKLLAEVLGAECRIHIISIDASSENPNEPEKQNEADESQSASNSAASNSDSNH